MLIKNRQRCNAAFAILKKCHILNFISTFYTSEKVPLYFASIFVKCRPIFKFVHR